MSKPRGRIDAEEAATPPAGIDAATAAGVGVVPRSRAVGWGDGYLPSVSR